MIPKLLELVVLVKNIFKGEETTYGKNKRLKMAAFDLSENAEKNINAIHKKIQIVPGSITKADVLFLAKTIQANVAVTKTANITPEQFWQVIDLFGAVYDFTKDLDGFDSHHVRNKLGSILCSGLDIDIKEELLRIKIKVIDTEYMDLCLDDLFRGIRTMLKVVGPCNDDDFNNMITPWAGLLVTLANKSLRSIKY